MTLRGHIHISAKISSGISGYYAVSKGCRKKAVNTTPCVCSDRTICQTQGRSTIGIRDGNSSTKEEVATNSAVHHFERPAIKDRACAVALVSTNSATNNRHWALVVDA